MSTSEAAEVLEVSPRTVRNLIGTGVLEAVKINPKSKSVYRVTVGSVHKLLASRKDKKTR